MLSRNRNELKMAVATEGRSRGSATRPTFRQQQDAEVLLSR